MFVSWALASVLPRDRLSQVTRRGMLSEQRSKMGIHSAPQGDALTTGHGIHSAPQGDALTTGHGRPYNTLYCI